MIEDRFEDEEASWRRAILAEHPDLPGGRSTGSSPFAGGSSPSSGAATPPSGPRASPTPTPTSALLDPALGAETLDALLEAAASDDQRLRAAARAGLREVGRHQRSTGIGDDAVCLHGFRRFVPETIRLPFARRIRWWSCRRCGGGHPARLAPGGVAAVLDRGLAALGARSDPPGWHVRGALHVDWLSWRRALDVDEVLIEDADDRDLEALSIALANDPDPHRDPRRVPYRWAPDAIWTRTPDGPWSGPLGELRITRR